MCMSCARVWEERDVSLAFRSRDPRSRDCQSRSRGGDRGGATAHWSCQVVVVASVSRVAAKSPLLMNSSERSARGRGIPLAELATSMVQKTTYSAADVVLRFAGKTG